MIKSLDLSLYLSFLVWTAFKNIAFLAYANNVDLI